MKTIEVYFDGGIRGGGNPGGLPSYGFFITCDGKTIYEGCGILEEVPKTNNMAEWSAFYFALQSAYETILRTFEPLKYNFDLKFYGDSQLVIKQIKGEYSIKSPHLQPAYSLCRDIIAELNSHNINIDFIWIPREKNTKADKLAEKAYKNYVYPF